MMHALHVDVGEATFYQEAAKLQCQATTRVQLSLDHSALAEKLSINADILSTLDVFYRVARPLHFVFSISFDDSIRWQADARNRVQEHLAHHLASAQVSPLRSFVLDSDHSNM